MLFISSVVASIAISCVRLREANRTYGLRATSEKLRKQIYDIAHQEHERKMRMLKDIMKLKIKVLVMEYHQRK
jgi:hypothetical protein